MLDSFLYPAKCGVGLFLAQTASDTAEMAGSNLDFTDHTVLHPLGLLAVIVLGITMILVPRRWSILPMIIMACFIAPAQRIAILTIDFTLLRIMVLFGVCRLYVKKETSNFVWNFLDIAVVFWTIAGIVIFSIQQGTVSALINRLGFGFDAFGMYFLFRCLIQNWVDVDRIIWGCILVSIPVAVFFLLENRTGRNLFSIFGGVSAVTAIRDGRLRCQGAFPHAIMAGCFWASLMPLFAARWWKRLQDRVWAITGLITSSIIVICCASSTPVMGVLSGILGGLFFCLRYRLRLVRWTICLTLIALHIVMKAPVWHLISRVSAVGGSTGWHRYHLINETINHVGEWFLLGTRSTAHWGLGLEDVTNQYVLEGVRGGFLTLGLFMALIVIAFGTIGKLWRRQVQNVYPLALSWAFGVSLFVHCMSFIGVSYFGQIWILWYLLLAMVGSMSVKKRVGIILKQSVAGTRNASTSTAMRGTTRKIGKEGYVS